LRAESPGQTGAAPAFWICAEGWRQVWANDGSEIGSDSFPLSEHPGYGVKLKFWEVLELGGETVGVARRRRNVLLSA